MYEIYRNVLKERMNTLEIDATTLAEMVFMDEGTIRNIINNEIPYEMIEEFDIALICNVLHCDEQYFAYQTYMRIFLL